MTLAEAVCSVFVLAVFGMSSGMAWAAYVRCHESLAAEREAVAAADNAAERWCAGAPAPQPMAGEGRTEVTESVEGQDWVRIESRVGNASQVLWLRG
ncbi:hypothetical protein GCM10010885_02220 [Alicyclobacillus cellulosilyticus]|uniref:Uncharacterized protein n=1 Tax=Alicyclobacillus cellulosilyticus TaxID=1003997 RepID=A0A917K2E1_9BACL|nr:hypothetical protein [Alicyclobacillus cellulosilyticus]GGI96103.1 hypothetical protein GCM10010885_02220 [Alicyclobacillus cellulosilyticus]